MSLRRATTAFALMALTLVATERGARAGDRELEILLVNMTPDPVSDEARSCADRIRRVVRDGYTNMSQIGETAFRAQVGDADGDFMEWTAAQLRPVKERDDTWLDTVLLYDCRPNAQRADILIAPADGELRRLRLRGVPIDDELTTVVATRALAYGWLGFSP